MKQLILIIILSVPLSTVLGQIGINTAFPKALIHIDAGRDNPSDITTPLSTVQVHNDIVITNNGNLGIGIIDPQEKLHLHSDKSIEVDALKFTPGGFWGGPAALTLQVDGETVEWGPTPSSGIRGQFRMNNGVFLKSKKPLLPLTRLNGNLTMNSSTEIRIFTEGRYLVNIDFLGLVDNSGETADFPLNMSVYFYLYKKNWKGDVEVDVIEVYQSITVQKGAYSSFSTTLYAGYCDVGDLLYLRIDPVIGFQDTGSLTINSAYPAIVTVYNI